MTEGNIIINELYITIFSTKIVQAFPYLYSKGLRQILYHHVAITIKTVQIFPQFQRCIVWSIQASFRLCPHNILKWSTIYDQD